MSDLNVILKNWNAAERLESSDEFTSATPKSATSMRMSQSKANMVGYRVGSSVDGSSSGNNFSNYRRSSQILTSKLEKVIFNMPN